MRQNDSKQTLRKLILDVSAAISNIGSTEGIAKKVESGNTNEFAEHYTNSFAAVLGHKFGIIVEDTSGDVI